MSGSAGRLAKFCLSGLLLGLGLSCALLVASFLTGAMLWNDSLFGRLARAFWPAASLLGGLDVDIGRGAMIALLAISAGANGILYAFLGLIAFFVDRLVGRIAEAISARQTHSKKA
jgi:hypothetical protein